MGFPFHDTEVEMHAYCHSPVTFHGVYQRRYELKDYIDWYERVFFTSRHDIYSEFPETQFMGAV